jgi:hypothetical protein
MNWSFRHSRHAADVVARRTSPRQWPLAGAPRGAPDCPLPGEVIGEIGVILAVHLAIALAVTLALRAFGIA